MNLKEKIVSFILKRKVMKMLDNLKAKVEGKKTYITAAAGILVAFVGFLFGPIDLAGVSIPAISSNELWKLVWEAALVVFIRNGVSSSK